MKSYLENNQISNYSQRQIWIDEHPNLLSDLLPQCKFFMCLIYHIREFTNLSKKSKFFNITWSWLNKYAKLLEQLGFIQGKKIGRKKSYIITRKGDIFVLTLFDYFRNGHQNQSHIKIKEKEE